MKKNNEWEDMVRLRYLMRKYFSGFQPPTRSEITRWMEDDRFYFTYLWKEGYNEGRKSWFRKLDFAFWSVFVVIPWMLIFLNAVWP